MHSSHCRMSHESGIRDIGVSHAHATPAILVQQQAELPPTSAMIREAFRPICWGLRPSRMGWISSTA